MTFNAAMERQRADARKSWVGSGEAGTERLWLELREKLGGTEFLGYDTHVAEGQIVALVVDGKEVAEGEDRHRSRDHHQPDAVLWQIRRPAGRYRHALHRRRAARNSPCATRRSTPAISSFMSAPSSTAR